MSAFAALQRLRSTPAPSPAATTPATTPPEQSVQKIPAKRQAKKAKNNEARFLHSSTTESSVTSCSNGDGALPEDGAQKIKIFSSSLACKPRNSSALLVQMKKGDRLVLLGSYGLSIWGEAGEITISGTSISPSSSKKSIHWIHAPHSHAVPVIRCRIDAQIEIHSHPSAPSLRQLSRLNPVFRNLWDEGCKKSVHSAKQTFQLIETSKDVPRRVFLQDLVAPPEWNQKLRALEVRLRKEGPISILVCGPKSSGKSTFGRLLCNTWLSAPRNASSSQGTEVAVLDIDPGQPEYAPAGLVSLVHVKTPNLGASFTHPVPTESGDIIVRSHAIASSSPASDPEFYVSCVLDLHSKYRANLGHLPLVVNTAGWIQGTGLDILISLVPKIVPSEVVYMSVDGPTETVEAIRSAAAGSAFSQLPSQSVEYTSRTAAHLRTMQTMSYFHIAPPVVNDKAKAYQGVPPLDWDPTPLATHRPTVVRYSGRGGVSAIYSYHHQPHPDDLVDSILGRAVAIVELESPSLLAKVAAETKTTPEGLPYIASDAPLDPSSSNALGLALIRGFDPVTRTVDVISPVPLARISAAVKASRPLVFVSGSFDLPTWFYVEEKQAAAGSEGAEDDEDEEKDEEIEIITDEDTSEDSSGAEGDDIIPGAEDEEEDEIAWVETLKRNQKRSVGSRVWRVRRDLGRRGD